MKGFNFHHGQRGVQVSVSVFLSANVIGSGIFLSPVGVLQNMGSVGSTLVMWAVMGIFCLVQALCYTELASVIPKTGGDYTYIHQILGELPAFVAVWGQIFLVVATSNAAIALTASVYLWQPFGIDCNGSIVSCTAIVIICKFMPCIKWSHQPRNV